MICAFEFGESNIPVGRHRQNLMKYAKDHKLSSSHFISPLTTGIQQKEED